MTDEVCYTIAWTSCWFIHFILMTFVSRSISPWRNYSIIGRLLSCCSPLASAKIFVIFASRNEPCRGISVSDSHSTISDRSKLATDELGIIDIVETARWDKFHQLTSMCSAYREFILIVDKVNIDISIWRLHEAGFQIGILIRRLLIRCFKRAEWNIDFIYVSYFRWSR